MRGACGFSLGFILKIGGTCIEHRIEHCIEHAPQISCKRCCPYLSRLPSSQVVPMFFAVSTLLALSFAVSVLLALLTKDKLAVILPICTGFGASNKPRLSAAAVAAGFSWRLLETGVRLMLGGKSSRVDAEGGLRVRVWGLGFRV